MYHENMGRLATISVKVENLLQETDVDTYVGINFSAGKKSMDVNAYESTIEYFNESCCAN